MSVNLKEELFVKEEEIEKKEEKAIQPHEIMDIKAEYQELRSYIDDVQKHLGRMKELKDKYQKYGDSL